MLEVESKTNLKIPLWQGLIKTKSPNILPPARLPNVTPLNLPPHAYVKEQTAWPNY